MDYPECINSSNLYSGNGTYANIMSEIVGPAKMHSLALDKKHNAYPGSVMFPKRGNLLNRYVINGMLPRFNYGIKKQFYHYLDTGIMPVSEEGIVTVHDLYNPDNESTLIKKTRNMKLNKYKKFQHVISISETTRVNLLKFGFSDSSIKVIHHGVSVNWRKYENIREIREGFNIPTDKKVVLTVSDGPFKNNSMVTEALKNTGIVHVHVGKEAGEIKIRDLSLEGLNQLICASDVLVRVSSYEGFGFPPIQALTVGVPIVLSKVPVFWELFEDSAFFSDISREGIINSVNQAIREKDEYLQKIGNKASYFSFESFKRRMDSYYSSIKF